MFRPFSLTRRGCDVPAPWPPPAAGGTVNSNKSCGTIRWISSSLPATSGPGRPRSGSCRRPGTGAELFALAPDPTAIGTLALLLLAGHRLFWALWIIPLLWLLNSALTLWAMGSAEAWAPLAAKVALVLGGVWRGTMKREGIANSENGELP